jgi:hypothetical protein
MLLTLSEGEADVGCVYDNIVDVCLFKCLINAYDVWGHWIFGRAIENVIFFSRRCLNTNWSIHMIRVRK